MRTPEKWVDAAETAIESEIEAVRERPSTEVLTNGKKVRNPKSDEVHYRFETSNPSLRFAEKCQATFQEEVVTIYPVDVEEEVIVFSFPKDFGEVIHEVALEWENDFVLKRIRDSLTELLASPDQRERINRMIQPAEFAISGQDSRIEWDESNDTDGAPGAHDTAWDDIYEQPEKAKNGFFDDGQRNTSQRASIKKAMEQPVSLIWGPPGTGKTATLAYIMVNYVIRGKSVLFVSNTNRAVDHGVLAVMEAMETLGLKAINRRITRFGERVLESEKLDRVHFEKQLEELMRSQIQEAADLQQWLDALNLPDISDEQREHISRKIDRLGGEEAVEDQIRELTHKERFAFTQLRRFKVVGTTLARVCTSEMLEQMDFDAVVVDEASMANIPYMLVMASKAKEHLVVVGDPMQLPPIAVTNDIESRNVLEQDIFAIVSGAKTTGDLFLWHDRNPVFTSFFNIQYRMQSDLAHVISEVFYEGRLISATEQDGASRLDQTDTGSVMLVDSSEMKPRLRQDTGRKGFQPINDTHVTLLIDMVQQVLMESRIGLGDLGIIVPFRSTVWHLRRELRGKHRWHELEIGTIHTFQGREKKVIILDTVMTGEAKHGSVRHYSVRPFDETKNGLSVPRLLNVAFSRSRQQLIVLADMEHVRRIYGNKFLGKLLSRLPVKK